MAKLNLIVVPSPPTDRSAGCCSCYIGPAPLVDVLFDQLEYLVGHTRQVCHLGCRDCARLDQVQRLLLMPFEAPDAHQILEFVAA
jgi:hypothetical protein